MPEFQELLPSTSQLMRQGANFQMIEMGDFAWTDDFSYHRTITCRNHPSAVYTTKNYFSRHLHCIQTPQSDDEGDIKRTRTGECDCPVEDLVVAMAEGSQEEADMKAAGKI